MNNSTVTSSVLLLGTSQSKFIFMRMLFTRTEQAGTARDNKIWFGYPETLIRDVQVPSPHPHLFFSEYTISLLSVKALENCDHLSNKGHTKHSQCCKGIMFLFSCTSLSFWIEHCHNVISQRLLFDIERKC